MSTAPPQTIERPKCPKCGSALPPGDSTGLCARCLLGSVFLEEGEEDPELALANELTGNRLGGFEDLVFLGRGGMGTVFRAKQIIPERHVALKVMSAGELATRAMVERFQNEARAASRLQHSNIVPVYEVGEENGWHFFSMEYISGPTLGELIAKGQLTQEKCVKLLIKIARAIEHAHQRGILHRDLKPSNILIDEDGEPHLTDFGLAKIVEKESDLTRSRAVLGTPAYMSPEQASGKTRDVTIASDIYGLGAIFYEMLTGQPPFQAENPAALLRMIVEEDPMPPRLVVSPRRIKTIDPDVEVICLKCLEKSPTARYHSASELVEDLNRWVNNEPILARPASLLERTSKWAKRHPAKAMLALTVLLGTLIIAVGTIHFTLELNASKVKAEQLARESKSQLITQQLRESSNRAQQDEAMSGMHGLVAALEEAEIAFPERAIEIRKRIGLVKSSSPQLRHMWVASGTPATVQFSRDGERLLLRNKEGPGQVWNLHDAKPFPLHGTNMTSFFNESGQMAVHLPSGIGSAIVQDLNKGGEEMVSLPEKKIFADFSRDEQLIAFCGRKIDVWNRRTGLFEKSLEQSNTCQWAAFSPDAQRLLALYSNEEAVLWDLQSASKVAVLTNTLGTPGWSVPSMDRDGSYFLIGRHPDTLLVDARTLEVESELNGVGVLFQAVFSGDGKHIATASFRGQARIWDREKKTLRPPTLPHESGSSCIAISPDGQFVATGGFDYQVRVWRLSDLRLVFPTFQNSSLITSLAFSPDGALLAISSTGGAVQVWDLSVDVPEPLYASANPMPLTSPEVNASWSGNNTRVVMPRDSHTWQLASVTLTNILPIANYPGNSNTLFHIDYSGSNIIAAYSDGVVKYWSSDKEIHQWRFPSQPNTVAFNRNSPELVLGVPGLGLAHVQLTKDYSITWPFSNKVSQAAWSPAGYHVALAHQGTVEIYNPKTWERLRPPVTRLGSVWRLLFSSDSRLLAVGYGDSEISPRLVLLFDLLNPSKPPLEMLQSDGVQDLVFNYDNSILATAGEDNTARLWDTKSGLPVAPTMRHDGLVRSLDFTPDGKILITGSNDNRVRFWNAETGELMGPPILFPSFIPSMRALDNQTVMLWLREQMIWKLSIPVTTESIAKLRMDAVLQTSHRSLPRGGVVPVAPKDLAAALSNKPSHPRDTTDQLAWHRRELLKAEKLENFSAAQFHQKRISVLGVK